MGNNVKFEIHQVENLYLNLSDFCGLVRRDFPSFSRNKLFRLYIPKYAVQVLKMYAENRYQIASQSNFTEGESEFEGFPIHYSILNEISAGPLDFHFSGLEGKTYTMKKFFEQEPQINKV